MVRQRGFEPLTHSLDPPVGGLSCLATGDLFMMRKKHKS